MRRCAHQLVLALVTTAVVTVAGCSSSPSSTSSSAGPTQHAAGSAGTAMPSAAASGGKITIKTTDQLMFSPSVVTTSVGKLTVTLTNSGSYPHNLMVPTLHVTSHTVSGDPGSTTTTVTLRFTKPGRYPFICTYHASAGMRGMFVVK